MKGRIATVLKPSGGRESLAPRSPGVFIVNIDVNH